MAQVTKRYSRSLNPGEVHARLKVTFGSSGAVAATVGTGVTVALTSTGTYTLTFDRGFKQLVCATGRVHRATGSNVLLEPRIPTDYVAGDTTLVVETCINAGTATEPSSGDFMTLDLVFDELGLL